MRYKLAIAAASVLLSAGMANAAIVPEFTGYSVLGLPCNLCDSFVNFSVYQNTDGDWTDDAFFGGVSRTDLADIDGQWAAAVDSAARFVYMYQVINSDPGGIGLDNPLRNFNIAMPQPLVVVSGAGYFDGVFLDAAFNVVNNAPDFSLDNPDPGALLADTANDGAPSASFRVANGLVVPGVAINNPATVRSGLLMSNPSVNGGNPSEGLIFEWQVLNEIASGNTSGVVFWTSDFGPTYRWAETESPGGFGSVGDVPSVPVPATLGLLMAGLGVLRLLRRAG